MDPKIKTGVVLVKLNDDTIRYVTLNDDQLFTVLNLIQQMNDGHVPIHESVIDSIDIIDNPKLKKYGSETDIQ